MIFFFWLLLGIFFLSFFSFFFLIFFFSCFFSCFLMYLGFFLMKSMEMELCMLGTLSKYECGYSEFDSKSYFYTMQFFIIALSFMLFDMEIIMVLPYIYINGFSQNSLFFVCFFLSFLMLSLFYEMSSGSFKWN